MTEEELTSPKWVKWAEEHAKQKPMTEEEGLEMTRAWMKKLKSNPMTPEQKAYNDWMDDVEAGISRTMEEKRARLERYRKQHEAGIPMK